MQRKSGASNASEEDAPYDEFLKTRPTGATAGGGHFSQWGPTRPRHEIDYPLHMKRSLCWRRACRPAVVICTCVLVFLSLVVLAGIMLVLSYYAKGALSLSGVEGVVGPGDTQNLFFSPLFCEQLSPDARTLYSSDYEPSHLYVLDRDPTLTATADVSFQDRFTIFDKTQTRAFHFYANSYISFSMCIDNATYFGLEASYFLVRGQDQYESWANSGKPFPPPFIDVLQVREICSVTNRTYNYTVPIEDQYYLIFANDKHSSPFSSQVVVDYSIRRTVHNLNSSNVLVSCEFTTEPCSVRVPLRPSASALLVYGVPFNWEDDWSSHVISMRCAPRVWIYVLACALGVLVIAVFTLCLCCCCCHCCLGKEGDDSSKPLLGQHTADLYGNKSGSSEMLDPSRDGTRTRTGAVSTPSSHATGLRHPDNPHPPPSFKKSGRFSLGSPTCQTFASNCSNA